MAEVQRVVKALLGYGARMPKELMLYVKNMVFLDGAMSRLAPDLDLLARDRQDLDDVRRPSRRAPGHASWASTPPPSSVDLDGVKAGLGVDASTDSSHLPRPAGPSRADPEAHPRPRRPLTARPSHTGSATAACDLRLHQSLCLCHGPTTGGRGTAMTQSGRRGMWEVGSLHGRASRRGSLHCRLSRSARRPPARGGAADHGEGRRLRGHPRRRRCVQAAQLDERAEHAGRG